MNQAAVNTLLTAIDTGNQAYDQIELRIRAIRDLAVDVLNSRRDDLRNTGVYTAWSRSTGEPIFDTITTYGYVHKLAFGGTTELVTVTMDLSSHGDTCYEDFYVPYRWLSGEDAAITVELNERIDACIAAHKTREIEKAQRAVDAERAEFERLQAKFTPSHS